MFFEAINGNFERSQYFNIETIFWKTKAFFKKLENPFLDDSTKIENV